MQRQLMIHAVALACAAATSTSSLADDPPYTLMSVETPDEVIVSVQSWGNPDGLPIVFLHGFTAHHQSWRLVAQTPELEGYHLVTYDMRGHGMSEKPLDPERYQGSQVWADEVDAVLQALDLEGPILVGASYAGRIIGDYLKVHGDDRLSGVVFAGGGIHPDPDHFGPPVEEFIPQMVAEDLSTLIDGTRGFLEWVTAEPIPREAFERVLAGQMMVPRAVRAALLDRPLDYEDTLTELDVPTLVVHGGADEIILPEASEQTTELVADSELIIYDGVGHALWVEAQAFAGDLAEFASVASDAQEAVSTV